MGKSVAFKADKTAAREAERNLKNNPFQLETRPWKMFNQIRAHSSYIDAQFCDLEDVYGFIGTPRIKIDNQGI